MADDDLALTSKDFDRFEIALRKAPELLYREMAKRVPKYMRGFVRDFKRDRFQRDNPDTVAARTGSLRQAFDTTTIGHDLDTLRFPTGTIQRGLPYAFIQEFGGEITPKRAQWLTIPLAAAKTPAGVMKKPAREWENTFFRPIKGGAQLLLMQRQAGREALALFLLVKRVRIAGKLGFFRSWAAAEEGFFRTCIEAADHVLDLVATAPGGSA